MSQTVVFVHGFLGFNRIRLFSLEIDYFRRVEKTLRSDGLSLCFPALPASGTVAERAEALAALLNTQPAKSFIIIAHSMGGLDARYLIRHLDPDHRVRCLVTIGTPHRGSPVARWLLETEGILQRLARHRWKDALEDLTPETCCINNTTLADRDDVLYISYAGKRPLAEQPVLLQPFGKIITAENADNDGLVSVDSARWGDFRGTLQADHLELVGWNLALPDRKVCRPFPHLEFYRRLVLAALEESGGYAASGSV